MVLGTAGTSHLESASIVRRPRPSAFLREWGSIRPFPPSRIRSTCSRDHRADHSPAHQLRSVALIQSPHDTTSRGHTKRHNKTLLPMRRAGWSVLYSWLFRRPFGRQSLDVLSSIPIVCYFSYSPTQSGFLRMRLVVANRARSN